MKIVKDARYENTDAFKREYWIFWAGNKKSFEMIVSISLALNQENWPFQQLFSHSRICFHQKPYRNDSNLQIKINKYIV